MAKLIVTPDKVELISTAQELEQDRSGDTASSMFDYAVMEHANYAEQELGISGTLSLLDWTFTDDHLTYQEAVRLALKATTVELCHEILRRARRTPRGRPSKLRIPAVKALLYKIHLGWTWRKLAAAFCPCGEMKHNASCRESLRSTVKRLQRQLRQYDLKFVPCVAGNKCADLIPPE